MNIGLKSISLTALKFSRNVKDFRSFHRWLRPTLAVLKKRKDKLGPEVPSRRSDFLEWDYNAELYAFGKRLGEEFNKDLLKNALIEKSYIIQEENKQKKVGIEPDITVKDNSNMAIDGENLMSTYITQYLETTLPNLPRKYIRNLKEYLLSEEVLAKVSKGIGIDDLVLSAEYPVASSTLARSLKSVIQALALSKGLDQANRFVRDLIVVELVGKDITVFCTPENPMEALEALLKEIGAEPPEPRLIAEAGRNTVLANFQVGIYSSKKMIGRGCGESIEIARDMAACDTLWRKWGILPQKSPFPFKIELSPKLISGNCQ